jgi:hypothetical protein
VNLETKIQKIAYSSLKIMRMGGFLPKLSLFILIMKNFEYEVHRVGQKKTECQNFCCSRGPNFASQTEYFFLNHVMKPAKKNNFRYYKKMMLVKNSTDHWIRTRDISRDGSVAMPLCQDDYYNWAVFESLM